MMACAGPSVPTNREDAFGHAVARSRAGAHAEAAAAAWSYLAGAGADDPRYDRAQRLLARSAEGLGLGHAAALWYLDIVQQRRDPKLVPEALRGLERLIEAGGHDEDTLVTGYLAATEFGRLPPDIQAFVDYVQGLDNARKQLWTWAEARFGAVPEESAYAARARYVLAVRTVATGDLERADAELAVLLESNVPADVALDASHARARAAYERGRYAQAIEHYEALREASPDDPELLLEMAWAHYRLGDVRRALGLLLALDAPAYDDLIAPERFLLESLCLRRLCQFELAERSAARLQRRHGDALADLYSGIAPARSEALRLAARRHSEVQLSARFTRALERQQHRLADLEPALGRALHGALKALYARSLTEARRQEREAVGRVVDGLAEELLAAEEGTRIILHELSIGLLRGRKRPDGPPVAPQVEIPSGGDRVFYRFDGEFWSDELDDLLVTAEDRCID
jgi:tetratricopeptide (TPR) repeat protein